jgi:hypothetical protein
VQEYVKTLVFLLPCKPNDKYGRVLDGRCEDGVQESEEEEVHRRGYFSSMIGYVVNFKGKVAVRISGNVSVCITIAWILYFAPRSPHISG